MEIQVFNNQDISKFFYLVENIHLANNRQAVLDWFTSAQRPTLYSIKPDKLHNVITLTPNHEEALLLDKINAVHVPQKDTEGKDFAMSDPNAGMVVYGVLHPDKESEKYLLVKLADDAMTPPFSSGDQFMLQDGMIENYHGPDIITDVGKFYLNELLLVQPFGDLIPYLNERFDPGALDRKVAALISDGKVTRAMYDKYMDNGYWYGEDGSISTACWSEKSLVTDPNVPKRKKELLEKYKDHLDDPVVLSNIEKELIAMDKAWLKGDSSEPFYAVAGGKAWKEQRKKMYLMFGLNTAFSKTASEFEFVADSLSDGWGASTLAVAANDIRRGSYGRGIETAKGGEQTKFVLRIFQEVAATEDDCGTKRGLKVTIADQNLKTYIDRYLVDGTLLTNENIKDYIGKEVVIRSPMYCNTKNGFCFKCLGELLRKAGIKRVGMQAISITAGFTNLAMKTMHQGGVSSTTVRDFKRFLKN